MFAPPFRLSGYHLKGCPTVVLFVVLIAFAWAIFRTYITNLFCTGSPNFAHGVSSYYMEQYVGFEPTPSVWKTEMLSSNTNTAKKMVSKERLELSLLKKPDS